MKFVKILHVVGARPNFMKLAPVYQALSQPTVEQIIVHTGQHYSANMSDIFFQELALPAAAVNLGIGPGSPAEQVAKIMMALEPVVIANKPDLLMVYGDVNSTLAAALVGAKLPVKIAHVEAGLRSFDSTMPEEINRIVTDRLADRLFTPSADADFNLKKEGVAESKIHLVGNVMIDTLLKFLDRRPRFAIATPDKYAVLTLHRPTNVDDSKKLEPIVKALLAISRDIPIFFSVHPRTKVQLELILEKNDKNNNIKLLDPLGYVEFLNLVKKSTLVITDSGGIQEETTFLGIPCLTLRENTERPVTVAAGTNTLIGHDLVLLKKNVADILNGSYKTGKIPDLWDGQTAKRIADILVKKI
jgi:UDP-N-acetylglucosamine 2-epimerase (non-hydrolysing)